MNLVDQINTHKYLYLDKLIELNDLELELWISEARIAQDGKELSENATYYGSIETDEFCKRYKITFKSYIAYSVINESFVNDVEDEKFVGSLFRKYSKSSFLDYVSTSATIGYAEDIFESKNQHFEIICLNHIIDVASCKEPLIEKLKG